MTHPLAEKVTQLLDAVADLLDSANQEKCDPDEAVVSSEPLARLADLTEHQWKNKCDDHLESCDDDGYCTSCGYQ